MELSNNISYLELVVGPMFSGKTLFLINKFNELNSKGKSVLVINHSLDKRYTNSNCNIVAHNGESIPITIITDKLLYIEEERLNNYDNILINEGQLFEDLIDFTKKNLLKNKNIYISGLDGDFKQNKFGYILDLIPICDNITKLKSYCKLCKNDTNKNAIFSHRIINNLDQTLIGSYESYIPICRKCYTNQII